MTAYARDLMYRAMMVFNPHMVTAAQSEENWNRLKNQVLEDSMYYTDTDSYILPEHCHQRLIQAGWCDNMIQGKFKDEYPNHDITWGFFAGRKLYSLHLVPAGENPATQETSVVHAKGLPDRLVTESMFRSLELDPTFTMDITFDSMRRLTTTCSVEVPPFAIIHEDMSRAFKLPPSDESVDRWTDSESGHTYPPGFPRVSNSSE